jgi:uncharacterized protein YjbI with pentapeptide repeats
MSSNSKHLVLTGKDFRGQDLSGSDFSYADIRGVNFTNTVLRGANFSNSKAGPRKTRLVFISIVGSIGSCIASLITGYAGGLVGLLMFCDTELGTLLSRLASAVFFVAFATFLFLFIRFGFGKSLGYLAIGIIMIMAIGVVGGAEGIAVAVIISTLTLAISIVAMIIWSLSLTTIYLAFGKIVVIAISIIAIACAIPGALEGMLPAEAELETPFNLSRISALSIACLLVIIVFFFCTYISRQIISDNVDFSLLTFVVNVWMAMKGTGFRGADLTDADFTKASLRGADFRSANLTRTCFFEVEHLDQARTKGTYLEDLQIQQLVVRKDAQEDNFVRRNLRGINLRNANLQRANLIGTDLSEATLENANLSDAKLVESRLYHTNLTRACLTGAFIQDWAISTDTVFDKVQCEFIYMRLPTEDDPDPWRKPDNRKEIFKEGDFSDFVTPIIKTLDLYQRQNVDPRQIAGTFKTLDLYHYQGANPIAVAVALKQLAEEFPEAKLEITALEGRADKKFRLQTAVAEEVDRSQLSERYSEKYREVSSLSDSDLRTLMNTIAQKDEHIQGLEKMVMAAIKSDKFYVETYYNLGDTMSDKRSIDIQVGGDLSGVVNLGTIKGNVTHAINQLPSTNEPNKPGLKELLTQLQTAIEDETELSSEDKAEALEQVKVLAEVGQKPEDSALKKAGKTALKILKGTTIGLSETTKLVLECAKLLPAIATLLALL